MRGRKRARNERKEREKQKFREFSFNLILQLRNQDGILYQLYVTYCIQLKHSTMKHFEI